MTKHQITIEIDTDNLQSLTDSYIASAWHVAQQNPAPYGDKAAGELVEQIGREIIRRWLAQQGPELYNHQGRDYFWNILRQHGRWTGPNQEWQPNETAADEAKA